MQQLIAIPANQVLNIKFHTRRLIVKALNTQPTIKQAASELGMSEKNLHIKIAEYKIKRTDIGYISEHTEEISITVSV